MIKCTESLWQACQAVVETHALAGAALFPDATPANIFLPVRHDGSHLFMLHYGAALGHAYALPFDDIWIQSKRPWQVSAAGETLLFEWLNIRPAPPMQASEGNLHILHPLINQPQALAFHQPAKSTDAVTTTAPTPASVSLPAATDRRFHLLLRQTSPIQHIMAA